MDIIWIRDTSLIRGYIKNGQLLIDARLYVGPGFNPVEIIGGEFVLKNPMWDRNFDDTALEIVNEHGIPVMQVIYTTPQNVLIYGIFEAPDEIILITREGMRGLPIGTPISEEMYPIKKLFKYPSRKYLGQELDQ